MLEGRRRKLVVEHLHLVRATAVSLARPGTDANDLESYGFEGLIAAARRFRFDRGVKFATFAVHRIRGAMLDALQRRHWRTGDFDVASGAATAEETMLDQEAIAEVQRALAMLVPREQLLLQEVYFKGKPVARAAGTIGISRWYASRLHASAVRQLRHAMEAR